MCKHEWVTGMKIGSEIPYLYIVNVEVILLTFIFNVYFQQFVSKVRNTDIFEVLNILIDFKNN